MSTTYTRSIATDFGGNLQGGELHDEIDAESGITKTLARVDTVGDAVYIVFDQALTSGEETTLNSLISSYSPATEVTYTQTHTAYAKKDFYKDTSYKDISTYIYDGSNKLGTIKDILCVAYKDRSVTNFSIRIYDDTNNNIISEKTFTNNTRDTLSMTPLSNIPSARSIITVQIKKSGGNNKQYVYIENIQFRI